MIKTSKSHAGKALSVRWAAMAGVLTLLLALTAAFLPDIELGPKSRTVGWILATAGLAEIWFGAVYPRVRVTAITSGLITAVSGLIFVAIPSAPYLPVANVVTLWLLARGSWVLGRSVLVDPFPEFRWLGITGAADLLLGFLLVFGLPVAVLVTTLFGPTPEIVARFSLILAASLLVTGVSEIAIARKW